MSRRRFPPRVAAGASGQEPTRPGGITALALSFGAGAAASVAIAVALLFPGSLLEPMWRLNPRAHDGFVAMGLWAPLLLAAVGVACALTACGLWRGRRWGHRLALALLAINFVGDSVDAVLGKEPRAFFGLPIPVMLLGFLISRRVLAFFADLPPGNVANLDTRALGADRQRPRPRSSSRPRARPGSNSSWRPKPTSGRRR